MNLLLTGLNHKLAPVSVLEKVSFPPAELPRALAHLQKSVKASEAFILSTCNRVELLVSAAGSNPEDLGRFLADYHGIAHDEVVPFCYFYTQWDAIRHLFLVAASLDSMIVGEPQILGQVKDAYEIARQHGRIGGTLNRLLEHTLRAGKLVRQKTGIGDKPVSIGYAAIQLAEKIFEDLTETEVLLLGAGEMIKLAARSLQERNVRSFFVANRTYEKACELAKQMNGCTIRYSEVPKYLSRVDIVISGTSAPYYMITREDFERALPHRRNRPIFLIDIAVPRDIEPSIGELDPVYLFDIDDLKALAEEGKRSRQREAKAARALIDQEVAQFRSYYESLSVTPVIKALRDHFEEIKAEELEKIAADFENRDEKAYLNVELMADALLKKILHHPIQALKESAQKGTQNQIIQLVQELFQLRAPHSSPEKAEVRKRDGAPTTLHHRNKR